MGPDAAWAGHEEGRKGRSYKCEGCMGGGGGLQPRTCSLSQPVRQGTALRLTFAATL